MLPVFSFLLSRVRSDRTTSTARRNFRLHSAPHRLDPSSLRDRQEADRLRTLARRQRQDLRARMAGLAREESDRAKSLHDRSNSRHKQVMLEAFDRQCDEAARILTEYQRRIHHYILQARDVRQAAVEMETEAVYSTVRGNRSTGDIVVVETSRERSVRKACETLADHIVEKIMGNFPTYDGSGVSLSSQLDVGKLGLDWDSEVPDDVKAVAMDALRNPSLLLHSITVYISRVNTLIRRETEKIDIKADAELLRSQNHWME